MWGNKARKMRERLGGFLDEGSEIEGKYTCAGMVMLDAKFSGEITSKDTLVIGERSAVRATVRRAVLVVHGAAVGNVTASGRVAPKPRARVTEHAAATVTVSGSGARSAVRGAV